MGYFEILKRFVLWENFLEKNTKARNIPLAVTDLLDKLLHRCLWRYSEGLMKGAAGRNDPKFAVKDEQWLAHSIDNGVGIRERVSQATLDFVRVRI